MSLVNFTTREITCKIVYYGPGRSGKTTNLQYIYGQVPDDAPRAHGVARHPDRPHAVLRLPAARSRRRSRGSRPSSSCTRCPGQVYYNATRKLVLQGADGVVFVADSQARQLDENIESLQNLQREPARARASTSARCRWCCSTTSRTCPRDLILAPGGARRRAQLPRAARASRPTPCTGAGVFETLKAISAEVLRKLSQRAPGRHG